MTIYKWSRISKKIKKARSMWLWGGGHYFRKILLKKTCLNQMRVKLMKIITQSSYLNCKSLIRVGSRYSKTRDWWWMNMGRRCLIICIKTHLRNQCWNNYPKGLHKLFNRRYRKRVVSCKINNRTTLKKRSIIHCWIYIPKMHPLNLLPLLMLLKATILRCLVTHSK